MKTLEKIINADDFGISPGVNQAIINGYKHGILNATSLMVNAENTAEAVKALAKMPHLRVGIHLTATAGGRHFPVLSHEQVPLLVDKKGHYKNGFLSLCYLSLVHKKALKAQMRAEFTAQIERALSWGIVIDHLDSHRHIHMIPALFTLTRKLKNQYHIPHLRVVNEDARLTVKDTGCYRYLFNAGLIKYALLTLFEWINRYHNDTYFYSIFHTMHLFGKAVARIRVPRRYARVELNIHPSMIGVDIKKHTPYLSDYLLTHPNRVKEYETALDSRILTQIEYVKVRHDR